MLCVLFRVTLQSVQTNLSAWRAAAAMAASVAGIRPQSASPGSTQIRYWRIAAVQLIRSHGFSTQHRHQGIKQRRKMHGYRQTKSRSGHKVSNTAHAKPQLILIGPARLASHSSRVDFQVAIPCGRVPLLLQRSRSRAMRRNLHSISFHRPLRLRNISHFHKSSRVIQTLPLRFGVAREFWPLATPSHIPQASFS
ncbi:hypothetical protein BH10PSE7_BH10PSE7_04970 [soil metagenome]